MEVVQSSVHSTSAYSKALEKNSELHESFVEEAFINMIVHN